MAAVQRSEVVPPGNPGQSGEVPPGETYTLKPLLTEGADSLPPDEGAEIMAVKLRRIEMASLGPFHELTTKTADDLFRAAAAAARHKSPFPSGAKLVSATFAFFFKGCDHPDAVEISPSGILRVQNPADLARVRGYLAKHHFAVTRVARAVPVLFLALLVSAAPVLANSDGDDDDDDCDGERRHAPLQRCVDGGLGIAGRVPFRHMYVKSRDMGYLEAGYGPWL